MTELLAKSKDKIFIRVFNPKNNEAVFEAQGIEKVNGWEIGRIGQELGKQANKAIRDFKLVKLGWMTQK